MNRTEDQEIAGAVSREREAIPASAWLRVLYSLTLVALVFPLGVAGMSGWVGLTLGTSLMGSFLLPLLALVVWRIYVVWRHPTTLVRHRAGALIALLRAVAVVEMGVGCLAALALLLQKPIIAALGGVRTEDGIEYYLLQLGAVMVGGLGLQGVAIFEWSRLIGMERFFREEAPTEIEEREPPAVVWLTAAALGLLFLTLLVPAGYFFGRGGSPSAAVLGLTVALPLTVTLLLRIVSVVTHRRDVPRPATGGLLGALRVLGVVGLSVYPIALVGSLLVPRIVPGLLTGGSGSLVMLGLYGLLFLGPLAVVALEASRLFGYERHERQALGAA